jgi:limonene 1,2-monooxygenase
MMEESLEAILALWRSDEPITRETDWFTIREGRLQIRPYSDPHPEVAVAAMVSPSGPRLAGKHGVGLLSLSMSIAEGFAAIGQAWGVTEEMAARSGQPVPDRRSWRVLGTVHVAESREQAIEDCTYGLEDFANYFGGGAGFVPLANTVDGAPRSPREYVEAYADSGNVVIGTPDDTIAYIEGLIEQSGGFGTFLMLGHDWANPEATMRSYRLFAEKVIPHFQGQLATPTASHDWATAKRNELFGRAGQAIMNAITEHVEDTAPATAGAE